MRILILGSSMTLPSDELTYDDTWLYRLGHDFPAIEVVDKCYRESSARRLNSDGPKGNGRDALDYFKPDAVITQIGVTDAAPRLMKRGSLSTRIVNRLPRKISTAIYNYLRKHRGRRLEYCDLTPQQLHDHFDTYCKRAAVLGVKVFMIEICHATQKVLNVSPKYNECIDIFNEQLHKVAAENENARIIKVVSADDLADFQSDGIHLTPQGQNKQYEHVKQALANEGII